MKDVTNAIYEKILIKNEAQAEEVVAHLTNYSQLTRSCRYFANRDGRFVVGIKIERKAIVLSIRDGRKEYSLVKETTYRMALPLTLRELVYQLYAMTARADRMNMEETFYPKIKDALAALIASKLEL